MGCLQLFNSLKTNPKLTTKDESLMFIVTFVNGKNTHAMVDLGASHNFIRKEEATRLEILLEWSQGWLNTVNSKGKPLNSVT